MKFKLKKKNIEESEIEDICLAMVEELHCAGYNLGYRAIMETTKEKILYASEKRYCI